MDKEGRDIVNSISASARIEGKYAQAMENYVDNPDRTNCPTRKYCRVSDQGWKTNSPTKMNIPTSSCWSKARWSKVGITCAGMPPANARDQYALHAGLHDSFVPGAERLAQLVCVDAAKIADHKWLYYRLGELGLDRLSTEGAAERNKSIAPDIAAPLIAAVVQTTGIVKMKTIEPMIANKHAFQVALNELHIMPLNPVAV